MKVVIAPDSFKESMSAPEAAHAIARGVRAVVPDAECVAVPMSDGGEGFTESIAAALDARILDVPVQDALGRPIVGRIAAADGLAAFEVASAVGLDLIAPEERRIMRASSRGVGQLLLAAADQAGPGGRVVVGLGGSATNDGGAGMLTACGARFLDADGTAFDPVPENLDRLDSIDLTGLDPRLGRVQIDAACDVANPLFGADGASAVFGPQKGASAAQVRDLDQLLDRLAARAVAAGADDAAEQPGAGAAGGLGWALMAVLRAHMVPGIELVTRTVGLAEQVADADLVLTGEGSVDAQTLQGKTPAGVAQVAAAAGVPCLVFAGRVAADADVLLEHGVSALVPILPAVCDLPAALRDGAANLERAAATAMRVMRVGAARG